MIKEIKVVEEHLINSEKDNKIKEIYNANKKLGTEELQSIDPKFKYLLSVKQYHFLCRRSDNVTYFVTTYTFSDINPNPVKPYSL